MTTVPFLPSPTAAFSFQPTLDGVVHTAIVTWNLFGQRYYINIYDASGELVVAKAMVGSPLNYNISLTAGYFASELIWRVQSGNFEILP